MAALLRVLLVSADRSLLRQGALMLEEFAVQVTTCADARAAQSSLAADPVDILLLDEDTLGANPERLSAWKQAAGARHVHLLLLCGETPNMDILEAFQCGADDFLHKPLCAGELLARLRAAARYGEFERRFQEQTWEDAVTGLWARQAIVDRLQSELRGGRPRKVSLVLLEIDFYDALQRAQGQAASHKALHAVVAASEHVAVANQCVARLEGGKFAVLLPDYSLEKAFKYAEKLRSAVAETQLDVPGHTRLTVSLGAALNQPEHDTPEDLLARAAQALVDAQRSGGDCVASYGQFDDDRRRWTQQMSSGNPFASCVARDVMTPFSMELSGTDTIAYAEQIFAQTELEVLPAIDVHGRLAGVLDRERVAEAVKSTTRSSQPIEPLLARSISKISDTTPFEKVIEQFVTADQPLLVVTAKDGRARGFIDRERFLNLVKPLESSGLAAKAFSSGTNYLVVPDFAESV